MTREITIFSNPVTAPGVCGKCGSQQKDWFVDLGFELEMQKFEPSIDLPIWLDGVLYLCCDCINDLVTVVTRKFVVFKQDHDVEVGFNGIPGSYNDSIFDGDSSETDADDSKLVGVAPETTDSPVSINFGAA